MVPYLNIGFFGIVVRYSNGKSCDLATIWILIILDHKQAFPVQFPDYHLNTGPFDNRHKSYHLYTRLIRNSDGYCIYLKLKSLFWPFKYHFFSDKYWTIGHWKRHRFVVKFHEIDTLYSNHLNTGLVWYSIGQKLSGLQMVRYSNGIWIPDLNTGIWMARLGDYHSYVA